MSLSRRRFLADLLFAAGGLTAAAVLAVTESEPEPSAQEEDPTVSSFQNWIGR